MMVRGFEGFLGGGEVAGGEEEHEGEEEGKTGHAGLLLK
jgi:hypothetical protein